MAAAPTLHSLLDEALSLVPDLSRSLLEATQDALDAKTQHFPLLDPWRRFRPRFAADFTATLTPLLQAGRRGEDPLQRRATSLDTLSLVDEQQALQDVAIAHVIQAIDDKCNVEVHQLGNVFAALRGTAKARAQDNPLRPAVFAHALYQSLFGIEMDPRQRYQLMQVAAVPLARALHRAYSRLCAQLRAAELTQLVASHAAKQEDVNAQTRFAQARLHQHLAPQPATLDGLARRVEARNSQPQTFDATPSDFRPTFVPTAAPDMLSRLYDQILADPRLLPPLKALLARLQIAVVRLSRIDTSLLRHQDHPTWQLLNRVAAHGMAFERADDERLQVFLNLLDAEVQDLIDAPEPSALLFKQLLGRVETHISQQAKQRSERSADALASLEREQQRSQWKPVLREQIEAQIAGAVMGVRLRRFLQTHWVDVILHAMVQDGREARAAQTAIEWVDTLLDSLQTPEHEAGRAALRRRLPLLIAGFRAGCDSINLPEAKREPVLQELMQQHNQLLSGKAARSESAPSRAAPGKPTEPTPEELLQRLLTERESQLPEHWAHTRVDRGELPTVPVQLYAETDSPAAAAAIQAWVQDLRIGGWYHLFIQSQWLTAQVAWISDTGLFFLFVGQDADERHSLTRGALEKLLANGLIAALDDIDLVQRAVDTLMQDFDDV